MASNVTKDDLIKWFNDQGGKIHKNVSVISGQNKHLTFITDQPVSEGDVLFEVPDDLILSLDTSDFAEIDFTEMHDELLSEMTPYRIQTLIQLFELLKSQCSVKYEPMPIVRKKKKKKRQKKAVVEPSGPVTGILTFFFNFKQILMKF